MWSLLHFILFLVKPSIPVMKNDPSDYYYGSDRYLYPFTKGIFQGYYEDRTFNYFDLQFYGLSDLVFYLIVPIFIYYIITLLKTKDKY